MVSLKTVSREKDCWNCGQKGHLWHYCHMLRQGEQRRRCGGSDWKCTPPVEGSMSEKTVNDAKSGIGAN
jgi:hypothetical protein